MASRELPKGHRNLLVDPLWVERFISAGLAPGGTVLLEVLFFGETPHEEQIEPSPCSRRCIPGAISVHPSYFESEFDQSKYYPKYSSPEDGNLLPDVCLQAALAQLGITEHTQVVVYGKGVVSPMSACRALWALMYAGVKDTRLLDGGFAAWESHGGETACEPVHPVPVPCFSPPPSDIHESNSAARCICRKDFLATSSEVAAISRGGAPGTIVDVRKQGEYEGWLKDNYGFFSTAGHIPSAIYQGDWDELIDLETDKLCSLEVVEARWRSLGIIGEPKGEVSAGGPPVVFYCGTGWRSSIAFVLAYMMGWDAKNYDDGWYGWSVGIDMGDGRRVFPNTLEESG
eukprot:TRINITY_DN40593_c0_g1_i1.p1 TRINITY_DN40593_c0_g1~~TRINITY_DN40593_c0_g1_i1.p1  ORF type:complete len:344 (-),score=44.06 TRINITY_DN40593_c0_g1_i1:217-1248(-)